MSKLKTAIGVSLVALTIGSPVNLSTASAKRRAATLKVVDTAASVSKYRIKKGTLYQNYRLTKRAKRVQQKYKKKLVYSNETITVRLPNGKKAVYQHLATLTGKSLGYINRHNVQKVATLDWNFGDSDAPYKLKKAEQKAFSKADLAQIKAYRTQAKKIGNSTKKMYTTMPQLTGHFNAGKLSAAYIQADVNWINFYRGLYGLPAVSSNPTWNADAQYGAATLAAVDQGLSHGLVAFSKPSFITAADWQRGAAATNSSNLYGGGNHPFDVITAYINDDGNAVPGHREWLLGGIQQVGIGQAKAYNDLKVFGTGATTTTPRKLIFPKAGLFPYEAAADGVWSVSLPGSTMSGTPRVTVYDQTAKKTVSVTHVHANRSGYGGFGTSIDYTPHQVTVNHTYQVSVTHLPDGQADLHYTTKLFSLTNNSRQ
ncbi:hypothetical protein [Levilactobacillus zymae]|uniref:hypothetical protein n=1 Tax=Levilactobacillus zymae TaxID=267363 RepID=UPI0028B92313|nr:hypothetical protein [Levilactobacillus zymae]MDT6979663.1 hypothetical protein [Levilactobacillus zymae]